MVKKKSYIAEVQIGVLGVVGKDVAGVVVLVEAQRLARRQCAAVDDDHFLVVKAKLEDFSFYISSSS